MKSKLSIYPRISCFYLILLRFSSSLSMAKRTVKVKLPSVCPRRHSNPVLFVPLKPYVLVASGSTPSQIKPQAHQWVLWLGPHCSQLFWGGLPINLVSTWAPKYKALMFCLRGACGLKVLCSPFVFLTTSTSQAEHKNFILRGPDQVHMFSSTDLPGRYAVLKIIIKSTFLFNFLKFVYVKNHMSHSDIRKTTH